jgi:ribosomal-protein-serine acetyltransferase
MSVSPLSFFQLNDGISLELIDFNHAEPLLNLLNSNRAYLKQWLPWVDYMETVEDFKDYTACKAKHAQGTETSYVITIDKTIVGRIGIHEIDRQNKSAFIGYWLGENFQGKGIITQACTALINYAFFAHNLNRIQIKCGAGNEKSKAIAEKLNFKKEGILRQSEWLNNRFIDLHLYAMLKEDWKNDSAIFPTD